jgi:hypothetical protein
MPGWRGRFCGQVECYGDRLIYSTFIPELYEVTLAVDAQGAAYIAGVALPPGSGSAGFPTTTGAFQTTPTGMTTGGIAKLNANGWPGGTGRKSHQTNSALATSRQPASVVIGNGRLYGVTFGASAEVCTPPNCGTVFQLAPD